jgi:acyl-CoA synthetase (AMP-forming)/AMP-acid ligase II
MSAAPRGSPLAAPPAGAPAPARGAPGEPCRLPERLAAHARARTHAEAFRESGPTGRAISYGDLDTQVCELAALLRAQAPVGAVLVCCGNRLEVPIAYLAVLAAGGVVVPVHSRLTIPELAAIAQTVRASAIIGARDATPAAPGLTRIGIDAAGPPTLLTRVPARPPPVPGPTLLLQSSGTTGAPKFAIRSGPSLDAVAEAGARVQRLTPDDRILACIPLSHSYGMENGLLSPLWAGSAVRLVDGFDAPTALRELRAGATVFPGVPFMFEAMAKVIGDGGAGSLRLAYSAGSPMPATVAARFRDATGHAVGQLYGATELGLVTFADPSDPDFDPATVGRAAPGVRIAILDPADPARALPQGHEGQVAVATPSMLSGYLHQPAPTISGLFLTGDLGRIDDRGRLSITGRLTLLIEVGGLKVNPSEVERALLEHPDIAECVVLPLRLSDTIHRIRAIVTPRPGLPPESLSHDALRRFAQERLAPHKVPRTIEVRSSLPKSPSGKVLRRELESA